MTLAYDIHTIILCAYGGNGNDLLAKALSKTIMLLWEYMPQTIESLPNSIYKDILIEAKKGQDTPFMSNCNLFITDYMGQHSFQGIMKERTISRDQATEFLHAAGLAPAGHGWQTILTGLL